MTGSSEVLATSELGDGSPLLLINGYAAGKEDWDPAFLEALARSSRVICPDNRGVGGSPPVGDPLTIAAMATDLIALLDQRGLDRVDVVGWSMGGFIAQALAAAEPDRVGGLVLLSTDPCRRAAIRASPEVWSRLIDHGGTSTQQATRLLALLFPPAVAAGIPPEIVEVVAAARGSLSDATLSAQEAAIDRWHQQSAVDLQRSIRTPALIAAGEKDVVIPPANARLLADVLPGSRVELYEGCGHAFMAQEPERLAASISSWLGR